MGFYLDGILRREVKADRNSKHNWVINVNLTHTSTSIYVPFTKWLLDFAGKPSIEKQFLLLLLYEVLTFIGGVTFMDRGSTLLSTFTCQWKVKTTSIQIDMADGKMGSLFVMETHGNLV